VENASNEVQMWAGASPQAGGSQPPLEETPGAAQPRLAARSAVKPLYDVVAEDESSLDSFEDAEDEVIKSIRFTILVGSGNCLFVLPDIGIYFFLFLLPDISMKGKKKILLLHQLINSLGNSIDWLRVSYR